MFVFFFVEYISVSVSVSVFICVFVFQNTERKYVDISFKTDSFQFSLFPFPYLNASKNLPRKCFLFLYYIFLWILFWARTNLIDNKISMHLYLATRTARERDARDRIKRMKMERIDHSGDAAKYLLCVVSSVNGGRFHKIKHLKNITK